MSVPTQTEMFRIVLQSMDDNVTRTRKAITEHVRKALKLSADDVLEETSSGIPVYQSGIQWAVSYLARASFLDHLSRSTYVLTESGHEILQQNLDPKAFMHVMNAVIAKDNPWNVGGDLIEKEDKNQELTVEEYEALSPEERIDSQVKALNESLGDDLMKRILDNTPEFFEQLVVDLVERMGYGKGLRTPLTGIDGMITTDELGFSPIYTQAKRYKPGCNVGAPEIQAFAGAMNRAVNGIFITTSGFTAGAINFANSYTHGTIKLIDGKELVHLMIKHKLGVTVQRSIDIMKIDLDYFES